MKRHGQSCPGLIGENIAVGTETDSGRGDCGLKMFFCVETGNSFILNGFYIPLHVQIAYRNDQYLVDQLVESSDLDAVNLKVNFVEGLVICGKCNSVVSRGGILNHFSKSLPDHEYPSETIQRVIRVVEEALDGAEASVQLDESPTGTPRLPIQGLPIFNGYACPGCNYHAVRLDTMKRHWRAKHAPEATPVEFQGTFVQSTTAKFGSEAFAVLYENDSEVLTPAVRRVMAILEECEPLDGTENDNQTTLQVVGGGEQSVFVERVGWAKVFDGHNWSYCFNLTFPIEVSEAFYGHSSSTVKNYLKFCHDGIGDMTFNVRVLFRVETDDASLVKSWEPFQEQTSLQKYSDVIVKLIHMLWNLKDENTFLKLPQTTIDALLAWKEHQKVMEIPGQEDDYVQDSFCRVHNVLKTVFFENYALTTAPKDIPVYVFWAINSMLTRPGEFSAPNVASRGIAMLRFAMRCTVYFEICKSGFEFERFTRGMR